MARWTPWVPGMALALMASAAGAQTRHPARVAVGPFSGLRAEQTRAMVFGVLAEHGGDIELVSQSDTDAAVERLGIRPGTDDAAVQLGRDLRVDDAVVGLIERRGRGYRLLLRVVRGRDGHSEGTVSWELDRAEELTIVRGEVWEQIRGYLHPDATPSRARGTPATTQAPLPDAVASSQREPVSSPGAPSEGAGAEGDRGSGATDTTTVTAEPRTPGVGWLALSLGGGLAGRSWRLPILGEPTARGYDNSGYGEIQGSLGLYYPLARHRLGIGVDTRIAIPLGLSSQGRAADGRVVPLASSGLEFLAGPSLVVKPVSGGSFQVDVGVVFHTFSIDTARLAPEMRLTNTSYLGLRVAGEAVLPLVSLPRWEFGLLFGGELRWVGVGSEMRTAFGASPTTTLGFGALFGLAARLDGAAPGLGIRAWAEFLRYRTGFTGSAMVGTASDSVDDYTRYVLAVTYSFGGGGGTSERSSVGAAMGVSGGTAGSQGPDEGGAEPPPTRQGDPFAPSH